ncbi:hypothetical protein LSTR_LSTR003610 [Laodelphax striatellus]|uniref:Uncharacterized protein n=1 Tax=Laodelphax striatellus TaxID=195883 RepID=A0A482WLK5_LAOST|nr:hypothetical protein LSTR_LSTR003610 [Laodelphax striatellus]
MPPKKSKTSKKEDVPSTDQSGSKRAAKSKTTVKKKGKGQGVSERDWSDDENKPKIDLLAAKSDESGSDDSDVPLAEIAARKKKIQNSKIQMKEEDDCNNKDEVQDTNKIHFELPSTVAIRRKTFVIQNRHDNYPDIDSEDDVETEKPCKKTTKKGKKNNKVDDISVQLSKVQISKENEKNTDSEEEMPGFDLNETYAVGAHVEPEIPDTTTEKKLTHKKKKKLKKEMEYQKKMETTTKKGGQGQSDLGENFTVSQTKKSVRQLQALQKAVDIKLHR